MIPFCKQRLVYWDLSNDKLRNLIFTEFSRPGAAVQYNRSFHVWRSSAALSASIRESCSMYILVFVFIFFSEMSSNFLGVARTPHPVDARLIPQFYFHFFA
jgi:hypothetical protein